MPPGVPIGTPIAPAIPHTSNDMSARALEAFGTKYAASQHHFVDAVVEENTMNVSVCGQYTGTAHIRIFECSRDLGFYRIDL